MNIPIETVRALRQSTGAGVLECKQVLEQVGGDLKCAEDILRERGLATAISKASRETREGLIDAYVHSGNRIGALIEVNCESDFVARTPEFRELVHNLAMQVAAMSPRVIDTEDVSDEENSPVEEVCLLEQPFIKDPSRTVRELIQETIARVGENVRVRQFSRFALGE